MSIAIAVTYANVPADFPLIGREHRINIARGEATRLRELIELALDARHPLPPQQPQPHDGDLQQRFVGTLGRAYAAPRPTPQELVCSSGLVLDADGKRHTCKVNARGSQLGVNEEWSLLLCKPLYEVARARAVFLVGLATERVPTEPYDPFLRGDWA